VFGIIAGRRFIGFVGHYRRYLSGQQSGALQIVLRRSIQAVRTGSLFRLRELLGGGPGSCGVTVAGFVEKAVSKADQGCGAARIISSETAAVQALRLGQEYGSPSRRRQRKSIFRRRQAKRHASRIGGARLRATVELFGQGIVPAGERSVGFRELGRRIRRPGCGCKERADEQCDS
jgi:hypothetical protein